MERSRWFFTEVLGLYASEETEEKVYLRAWQDWDHHTLILTKSDHPAWSTSAGGWRSPRTLGRTRNASRSWGSNTTGSRAARKLGRATAFAS